jgi:hypothetical protein
MLLDMPPTYRRIQRPMDGERKRRRKKRETEGNRMVGLMPKKRTDKWQRKKKNSSLILALHNHNCQRFVIFFSLEI